MEQEVFRLIDIELQHLSENLRGSNTKMSRYGSSTIEKNALNLMEEQGLMTYRDIFKKGTCIVDITAKGMDVLKKGGIEKHLEELKHEEDQNKRIKKLEVHKLLDEITILQNQLHDYPRTRKQAADAIFWARISAAVAIASVVIAAFK